MNRRLIGLLIVFTAPLAVLGKDPQTAAEYFKRGKVLLGKENQEAAIADFTKALELTPDNAEILRWRAYARREVGSRGKDANKSLDEALADCERAVALDPRQGAAFFERGRVWIAKGDLKKALADFDKAIELEPGLTLAYYLRWDLRRKTGDMKGAQADIGQAVQMKAQDAMGYNGRGLAHEVKGNLAQAVADYSQAIELEPFFLKAYVNRGLAYENLRRFQEALADFTKAIELNPRNDRVHVLLVGRGMAHLRIGSRDEALKDFDKSIEINPSFAYSFVRRAEARFDPDKGHSAPEDTKSSLADLAKALALNPRIPEPYFHRGRIRSFQKDYAKAIEDFTKAIEITPLGYPGQGNAYHYRGLAYLRIGQRPEAERDFAKAVELSPQGKDVFQKAIGEVLKELKEKKRER